MSELLAGVAEVDITPPIGHRMAGHFYEVESSGVRDPLKAKAIVLRNGEQTFALAFADVVGISTQVSEEVRWRFKDIGSVPVTNTMVCATHSHTGPLFDDVRRDYFHNKALDEQGIDASEEIYYPDFLTDQLTLALGTANDNLEPASLSLVREDRFGISYNRRYHMSDGTVKFNPEQQNPNIFKAAGPVDPEIVSLMIEATGSHKKLGALTVFACHPDTLGGTLYSADYPFFIETELQAQYGPEFVSAFAVGACGDINHIDVTKKSERKGERVAQRLGTAIGQSVLSSQPEAMPIEASFAAKNRQFNAHLQGFTAEQAAKARADIARLSEHNGSFDELVQAVKILDLEQRGRKNQLEVQVFRLSEDTALVGLPGEIFVDLGLDIKDESPFDNTIVITLANDRLGYIPTLEAFKEGSYEVENSRVVPGAGERLVDTALDLLRGLAS